MKAMKDNHSDIVEDWVSFVEDILKKETDENTNFYLINITKKLDLFKKRLEICNIVMRYIKWCGTSLLKPIYLIVVHRQY